MTKQAGTQVDRPGSPLVMASTTSKALMTPSDSRIAQVRKVNLSIGMMIST